MSLSAKTCSNKRIFTVMNNSDLPFTIPYKPSLLRRIPHFSKKKKSCNEIYEV